MFYCKQTCLDRLVTNIKIMLFLDVTPRNFSGIYQFTPSVGVNQILLFYL